VARALALLVALLALTLGAAPALGQEAPRASLPDIEDEVMCVTCNVPLNIADSPQASRERAFIQRLVDRGLTKEQVKDRLVAEYGEDVLAVPEDDGLGIAAYAVPIAIVLAMIAAAAIFVPRWRRPPGTLAGAPGPAVSDAELQRLDDDLAKYD
jgi:cytochrome c-type biogenesis protein CcmH/NrfF